MTSKKRWDEIYAGDNPLALPQNIVRGVRERARKGAGNGSVSVKYLWLYVSDVAFGKHVADGDGMSAEDWLNVVDEAAAHGCKYAIISVGDALRDHPEVLEMAVWGQSAHGITVGIHMYGEPVAEKDVDLLVGLDQAKTCFFAPSPKVGAMAFLRDHGFAVLSAEEDHHHDATPECHLPEEMTCVNASGRMYTCGLVLGDESYGLGHVLERKLTTVMHDGALPHWIPKGLDKSHRHCNGCPPLMIKRMRELAEQPESARDADEAESRA